MVLAPRFRMGPPSRSFAADAHDCIVVTILTDRPNTSSLRAICAHDGELPLGIVSVANRTGVRPRSRKSAAVLAALKGKSLRDGLRPPLTAAARSSLAKKIGRDGEMS
jgi:hypothetical protein